MALGADQVRILRGVLGEGAARAGGLVLGVVGALLLSRFLEGLLFEVTPLDTLTFIATGVSAGAGRPGCRVDSGPARDAGRADVALRAT